MINAIKYYSPQIVLIAIIFLPYEVEIRGLILLTVWTIYCTFYLIKTRLNERHLYQKRVRNSNDALKVNLKK